MLNIVKSCLSLEMSEKDFRNTTKSLMLDSMLSLMFLKVQALGAYFLVLSRHDKNEAEEGDSRNNYRSFSSEENHPETILDSEF